ncbi:MAG: DMT family transporter [Ilumatobacteraceae bacterium]
MTAGSGWLRSGGGRCAVAALLFGASAPAASKLATSMEPFALAGTLYLGAAIATLPFASLPLTARLTHRPGPAPGAWRRSARLLGLAVLLGGAVGPALLALGLARVPAATASLLLNLELVFTTVLALVVFREHVGRRVTIGTGFVVVAGGVLGWSGDPTFRIGAVLIAAACLSWAVDNGATAKLDELTPATITFVKGAVAGTVNLGIGLIAGGPPSAPEVLAALVIPALGYGASITLWVTGARELGAARAQLVFATAPFLGAIVAWTVVADRSGRGSWCRSRSRWSGCRSCSAAITPTTTPTGRWRTITPTCTTSTISIDHQPGVANRSTAARSIANRSIATRPEWNVPRAPPRPRADRPPSSPPSRPPSPPRPRRLTPCAAAEIRSGTNGGRED